MKEYTCLFSKIFLYDPEIVTNHSGSYSNYLTRPAVRLLANGFLCGLVISVIQLFPPFGVAACQLIVYIHSGIEPDDVAEYL